jgi:hypothetical protein
LSGRTGGAACGNIPAFRRRWRFSGGCSDENSMTLDDA